MRYSYGEGEDRVAYANESMADLIYCYHCPRDFTPSTYFDLLDERRVEARVRYLAYEGLEQ